ncbi:MAG: bifunctional metallophosphatase/5'-nucleotidase [Synergistaceae bacterium]|nr:bifunctional metallophosphatase/5'-nucleotidase [Synergistaceae bacterium]
MKNFLIGKRKIGMGFAGVVLALALAFGVSCVAAADEGPVLVIYHTNDVHGYAFRETNADGKPTRWGYDYVKAAMDEDDAKNKMLLDAGDVLHGQFFATARRGEFIARVLAMMGYDAIAAGNHDFDYGQDRLISLRDLYRLTFLSANVKRLDGGPPLMPSYVVRDFADLRVGVFGLTTPSTPTSTDPRNVAGLAFGSPEEIARIAGDVVRRLREVEGADIVIALTHLGSEPYCDPSSRTLAREAPGIDLIIDGHSHTELPGGIKVNDTLIVSSGSYLANLGRVQVNRKPGGGYELSARLLPASDSAGAKPNPELSSAMTVLAEELDKELNAVAARAPIDLDGVRANLRRGSTNMGRLICAALIAGTGADVAIINSGLIRDSIPAGDVTKKALLSVLPYPNYVFTVEATGADLLAALNHGLATPGSGAFPQFYGMTVTARKTETVLPDGSKAASFVADAVTIGGRPLDENAKYKVAINDFMYAGGDGYDMFGKYDRHEFGTLEDLFRKFLSEASEADIHAADKGEVLTTN